MAAQDGPAAPEIPDNDDVVGTAIKVSLSLLALVAAVGGILFVLQMSEPIVVPEK